jgi:hypothetical protein
VTTLSVAEQDAVAAEAASLSSAWRDRSSSLGTTEEKVAWSQRPSKAPYSASKTRRAGFIQALRLEATEQALAHG